jgi:predicted transcriptional regulator
MGSAALTAKQEVEKLLTNLPDDSTLEDIQYHLYVLEKIKSGRADGDAGRIFTHDEAKQRLQRWLHE